MIEILGAISALFGGTLLILPSIRVGQGRLEPKRAVGLWISGLGFLLMARAAFIAARPAAEGIVVAGALLAISGNIIQRYISKTSL